jgi:hypothetical protein
MVKLMVAFCNSVYAPTKPSKTDGTSTIVVSPDPLSPTPSTSTAMTTPENAQEDPDDPEPADE